MITCTSRPPSPPSALLRPAGIGRRRLSSRRRPPTASSSTSPASRARLARRMTSRRQSSGQPYAAGTSAGATRDRGAPAAEGRKSVPSVHTVFQQLHNYPVGTSGQERAESAKGNKYNITPVRREFLSDLAPSSPSTATRPRRPRRAAACAASSTPAAMACRSSAITPFFSTGWRNCDKSQ